MLWVPEPAFACKPILWVDDVADVAELAGIVASLPAVEGAADLTALGVELRLADSLEARGRLLHLHLAFSGALRGAC